MRLMKVFGICFFLILGTTGSLWAAEDADVLSADWQTTLEQLTAQSKALSAENEKLSSEYEFLQEKVAGLKIDLKKRKAELKQMKSHQHNSRKSAGKYQDPNSQTFAQMDKLQEEIDALQATNQGLEKELADIQEKNRLWKIQVSTLENKKRDVKLDANYQEATAGDSDHLVNDEAIDLQTRLDKSMQEEKDLAASLEKMTAQNKDFPQDQRAMKKENRDLQNRLKILKRQIAVQEAKNARLQKSAKKGKRTPRGVFAKLLKEKKALELEIAKLTKQLDSVSKMVGESQDVLEKKRQLMDQIMHLDAENQELHAKIDALAVPTN
jgi:chromosome segregation ATPase